MQAGRPGGGRSRRDVSQIRREATAPVPLRLKNWTALRIRPNRVLPEANSIARKTKPRLSPRGACTLPRLPSSRRAAVALEPPFVRPAPLRFDEVEAGTRGDVAGEVQASGGPGSVAGRRSGFWRGWSTRFSHIESRFHTAGRCVRARTLDSPYPTSNRNETGYFWSLFPVETARKVPFSGTKLRRFRPVGACNR